MLSQSITVSKRNNKRMMCPLKPLTHPCPTTVANQPHMNQLPLTRLFSHYRCLICVLICSCQGWSWPCSNIMLVIHLGCSSIQIRGRISAHLHWVLQSHSSPLLSKQMCLESGFVQSLEYVLTGERCVHVRRLASLDSVVLVQPFCANIFGLKAYSLFSFI